MSSVIIVQGSSSAYLYVQECKIRGLTPIVVNPPLYNPARKDFEKLTGGTVKTLEMKSEKDYGKTLDKVRELDPVCVVCGSSGGVTLADRMARDLGFKGNDPETTWRRDTKSGMQQSLKEAGIRYIRTAEISSEGDIDRFWKDVEPKKVMMKFDNSAGSVGNKICYTADEAKRYLREMKKLVNIFGENDLPLIQEFIEGEEYVVDTVSCDGVHMVTDMWVYKKIQTKNGDIIYSDGRLIVDPTPGITELVLYAYKVLDATGFRYGPCHGEFKIDEKGPVLIETNPRPIGATMTVEFMDECVGHHISDAALDSYLDPKAFNTRRIQLYRPRKHAAMVFAFSLKECDVNIYPLRKILNGLRSYRSTSIEIEDKTIHVQKTIDLETSPVAIKLCHENLDVINGDIDFIYTLESQYFDLLYSSGEVIPAGKKKMDVKKIVQYYPVSWKILVVTEKESYVMQYGKRLKTEIGADRYDVLVYADVSEKKISDLFSSLMANIDHLMGYGIVVVVPGVYENAPYGSAAVEVALRLCKCKLDIPMVEYMGAVVAYKNDG